MKFNDLIFDQLIGLKLEAAESCKIKDFLFQLQEPEFYKNII